MKWTSLAKGAVLLPVVVCLLGAGLLLRGNAILPEEPAGFAGMVGSSGSFVIADFDGDQQPDLATVRLDQTNSQTTKYSIQFQLSRGWQPAIGITARAGGLQLFWRDVNGDDTPDLVVRTSLDSSLVAVLLNDGNGKFTQAPTRQYAGLEKECEFHFGAERRSPAEGVSTLPLRTTFGEQGQQCAGLRLEPVFEAVCGDENQVFGNFQCESSAGRAPPNLS